MLRLLFSILFFGVVALSITRICTAKDWPLAIGLAIGVVGQIIGRITMSVLAGVLIANQVTFGAIAVFMPMLGMLFPLVLAWMLPPFRDRRQEWLDAHPRCSRCGAQTAVSTPVCEKCKS